MYEDRPLSRTISSPKEMRKGGKHRNIYIHRAIGKGAQLSDQLSRRSPFCWKSNWIHWLLLLCYITTAQWMLLRVHIQLLRCISFLIRRETKRDCAHDTTNNVKNAESNSCFLSWWASRKKQENDCTCYTFIPVNILRQGYKKRKEKAQKPIQPGRCNYIDGVLSSSLCVCVCACVITMMDGSEALFSFIGKKGGRTPSQGPQHRTRGWNT